MEVFGKLKCENPGPFFDLMVTLLSMALTDAGEPKEVVEGFLQRMKEVNKADGRSFLERLFLFIKNRLRRARFYSPSPADLTLTITPPADPDPPFAADQLTNCCALIYDPLRPRLVPNLEYPADHPWTMRELDSAVENEIFRYLFELVDFCLKQVGMEEEAKKLKVNLQVVAATAGVQDFDFQCVKLCKEVILPIERHKVQVLNAENPFSEYPTPPSNWKPGASSAPIPGRNNKVTETATVVEDSGGKPEAAGAAVAEGGGGKRMAAADAGDGGVGPSWLKKLKLF